ncbi:MAG: GDSL-type esterase/lipase family protein, partial [Actinobacteria bacterium]|nr:GDSL-type esterase/lipase family protein [Actinomycetota bacterium]
MGFVLLGLASSAALAAAGDETAQAGNPPATKLMPTGDSITEGNGSTSGLGFRALLYDSLNAVASFDFVGSPDSPGGEPPYEGHFYGGQRINAFRPGGAHDVAAPMNSVQPDMVAVHLGTNDINSTAGPYGPWSGNHGSTTTAHASGKLGALVKYFLDWRDGTHGTFLDQVVLSRIVPIVGRDLDMEVYNREVVRMVLDFRNGAVTGTPEPVYLADHYIQFLSNPAYATQWMDDDLHPNDAGYDQMESVYTRAVLQSLADAVPPATPTDLAIGTQNGESVLLLWTNTGDDGTSGDASYADCRYATGSITDTNFKLQNQGGNYGLIGSGGQVAGERITGLSVSTNYNFALKLMDDASQLSGMSNITSAPTLASADIWKDAFNRNMTSPGIDWSAEPEWVVNGTELENTGLTSSLKLAIFRLVDDAQECQFTWGAGATSAGIDNGGFAVRLDTSDPSTADGY